MVLFSYQNQMLKALVWYLIVHLTKPKPASSPMLLENRKEIIMESEKLNQIEQLLTALVQLIDQKSQINNSDIVQQKELLKQLGISPNTLKKWENLGLKRLEPPIEDTRTVFYQWSDVIHFLNS